jgi:EpsI family protein
MLRRRTFIFAGGAAASIAVAYRLTPKANTAQARAGKGSLDDLVPRQFGTWRQLDGQQRAIVSPDLQATLDTLYSDTLARTYVDTSTGQSVMLSLAYGANQSRSLRVHKPETCYSAQGFQISKTSNRSLSIHSHQLPVMQLIATQGPRVEYISYWIRSGNDIVRGWVEQNLSTLKHGLQGVIPDGILVRVSTIHRTEQNDYALHAQFIDALLTGNKPQVVEVLVGQTLLQG